MTKNIYTFIDLFAGLGGFHLALAQLGHKCVFASELKEDLRNFYNVNFPDTPIKGDITQIAPKEIPNHDILCGGFPCQPFSQAGKRQGFQDAAGRGNLFYNICSIIDYHKPKYVFLENVQNLEGHDNGNTWKTIESSLIQLGYEVKKSILSPHQFGIPQHRKRIYIVCARKDMGGLSHFVYPSPTNATCNINDIIDNTDVNIIKLRKESREQLEVWEEFIHNTIKNGFQIPQFPIWAMEFGATYDYKQIAPAFQERKNLIGKRGKLGQLIDGNSLEECLSQLPNYAQTSKTLSFPKWKISYIERNREFYEKNKSWLDEWIKKIVHFDNSFMKMEWNCKDKTTFTLQDKIVQFRASGIRIKLPTFAPALNLVGTQIPVLPWVSIPDSVLETGEPSIGRYLSIKEAARLQGMESLKFGNDNYNLTLNRTYEALGNAVNVEIVKKIANNLIV